MNKSAVPTPKVATGGITGVVVLLITFILSTYVFHRSLTAAEQGILVGVTPVVLGFVAAYLKKDTRLDTEAEDLAAKLAVEVKKIQPWLPVASTELKSMEFSNPALESVVSRLETVLAQAEAAYKGKPASPAGAATEPFKAPVGATAPAPVPPAARAGRVGVTVNENLNPTGFDPEVK